MAAQKTATISDESIEELLIEIEDHVDKFTQSVKDPSIYEKIILYANDRYYNDEPVLFDDTYDILVDRLKELKPNSDVLKKVGADVKHDVQKIELPYHMGSMDKFKPKDKQKIDKWKNTYKGPYMVHNKLDGISGLFIVNKDGNTNLYTRGNGSVGSDITHIIRHIDIGGISNIKSHINKNNLERMVFRGELIMKKDTFYNVHAKMPTKSNKLPANPRNFVSGLVNSKNLNKSALKDVEFLFYEIIEPWNNVKEQYKLLDELGIKTAKHILVDPTTLDVDNLSGLLKIERDEYPFEIDGLIVSDTNSVDRNLDGNPEYSFAFKDLSEIVEAFVRDVIWDISKDGYMIPVVNIVPVRLAGVMVSKATAFNGKYIKDNNINIGTVIKITRSGEVIPHIVSIIKPSEEPLLPDTKYKWSKSRVDIINTDPKLYSMQLVKLLVFFVETLGIKQIGESTMKTLVDENIINDVHDLFTLDEKRDEIVALEGFKDKKTDKILQNINEGFAKMTLSDLMAASNVFGRGFGTRKLSKIMKLYPDIILESYKDKKKLIQKIDDIEGFDDITATQFVENLPNFNVFLDKVPVNIKKRMLLYTAEKSSTDKNGSLVGMKIVFTGFRNAGWQSILESNGAEVGDSASKNTTILVAKDPNSTSGKMEKARKWGLKIMSQNEFIKLMTSKGVELK